MARSGRMGELLPSLHQRALEVSAGRCSVLTRWDPRTAGLQASTAAGLDHLEPDPWLTDPDERAAADRVWGAGEPEVVQTLDRLTARLQSRAAVLVPLQTRTDRLGLLIVGTDDLERAERAKEELAIVGDLLSVALEGARLRYQADLHRDLRELLADISRGVSSSLHIGASLELFCVRTARLLGADRVNVWLHDRRARTLDLVASSDASQVAAERRVSADADLPTVAAMRGRRAELSNPGADPAPDVLVALRGRRRALGTLELIGLHLAAGDEGELLDRIEELARHLSAAIENVWLLEDVLRSRRELESTFDSLADLVVVSDNRLRVTHANQAFAARLQRPPGELVEHGLGEFFGPEVVSWVDQLRDTGFGATRRFESRELPDPVLGGTFLFTVSPLVGRQDQRTGTVIVARDITDHARLEAERAELRNRLTQSEKLAALGQFVAGIAHELNNPLQGVLGHVELILQGPVQTTTRVKRDLKVVFREAERAAKIVHNLLVFAGSRRITRRRINANNIISRVIALRAGACAAANIEIVTSLAPKLPRVGGDALLLQQVLLNMVLNAEQALATVDGPRRIEVRTLRRGREGIEIHIADNGPGIPPEALPRIFEPFFTTKEVGQGTGLGLAIAYGIVQEHDGRLIATNRPEGGALFIVQLPSGRDAVE
jgi:C4-dicarboxylate-specific signal transduction histidine kinase